MAQVFISYSRVDIAFVEVFIKRLQRAFPELIIWHDQAPHGLIGGGDWWQDILRAIAASDVFIYILSNESVSSIYCQAEFTEARRLQKRIITVQARDRTELTDDLDDIQFINMNDGVESTEAFASLIAAVNLRLKEAVKYRNARALWKSTTSKPQKEVPPTRATNAPEQTTPALAKPSPELEALKLSQQGLRWQVLLGIAALGVTLLVGLMGLLPWLTDRAEKAAATQDAQHTFVAQTQVALAPATTTSPTESPTTAITPSATPTATATPKPLNPTEIEQSVTAEMQKIATEAAQMVDASATADAWTDTPVSSSNTPITLQASVVMVPITKIDWFPAPSDAVWGFNQTAVSIKPSINVGQVGDLYGTFNMRTATASDPRATYVTVFPAEDWRQYTEVRLKARFLPGTGGGSVKATIEIWTGSGDDQCYYEDEVYQTVEPEWTNLVFNLEGNHFKNCQNPEMEHQSLLDADRVSGFSIVFIPASNDSNFDGGVAIQDLVFVSRP